MNSRDTTAVQFTHSVNVRTAARCLFTADAKIPTAEKNTSVNEQLYSSAVYKITAQNVLEHQTCTIYQLLAACNSPRYEAGPT